MAKLVRRVIPARIYEALSIVRRHRRSQVLNEKFRDRRFEVDSALIEGVRVVPMRSDILKALPKGGTMAEIGVAQGEFTREILDDCLPSKIYLIDLWAADSARYADLMAGVEQRFSKEISSGVAEIRRGYSWDRIAELPEGSLDFAYVDAAHDYDSVAKDLRALEPKMAPGGKIGGHDYTRWSGNGLHRWGVVEAVNEFCNARRWRFEMLSNEPGRHLSYLLARA